MILKTLLSLVLLFSCLNAQASPRLAILAFELKDMTLAPGTPAEIQRTSAIKPLLENELASAGYEMVSIPAAAQQSADSGVGYLFDHPDVAAELGKRFGADFILVGRLHKPSFLFAYLMGHLIRVSDGQIIGNLITESKGPNIDLVGKAVETLADKIDELLENRYTPPLPGSVKIR